MIINCETYKKPPRELKNSCVTFGVFDGIHEGHLYEIEQCKQDAKTNNTCSVIVTFDIDPDEIFKKNFLKILSNNDRIKALNNTGVDYVIVVKFNYDMQNCNAGIFLDCFFGKAVPKSLHVGKDFKFGKEQRGNTNLLKAWGEDNNMKVHVHNLLKKDGKIISSTLIRENLYGTDSRRRHK